MVFGWKVSYYDEALCGAAVWVKLDKKRRLLLNKAQALYFDFLVKHSEKHFIPRTLTPKNVNKSKKRNCKYLPLILEGTTP